MILTNAKLEITKVSIVHLTNLICFCFEILRNMHMCKLHDNHCLENYTYFNNLAKQLIGS